MGKSHATYKGKYIIKVLGGYKVEGTTKVFKSFVECADSIQ